MAIKTNSGAVKHIYVKDKGYCKTVKKSDGTVMWAETAGTVWYPQDGGYPEGITSIVVTRMSSMEPTAETQVGLSDGDVIYNGDELKLTTLEAEQYWTPTVYGGEDFDYQDYTVSTPDPGVSERESDFYVANDIFELAAYRTMRTITVDAGSGVKAVNTQVTGYDGSTHTWSVSGPDVSRHYTWQGAAGTWAAEPEPGWYLYRDGGSYYPGVSDFTISVEAAQPAWVEACPEFLGSGLTSTFSCRCNSTDKSASFSGVSTWGLGGLTMYPEIHVKGTVSVTGSTIGGVGGTTGTFSVTVNSTGEATIFDRTWTQNVTVVKGTSITTMPAYLRLACSLSYTDTLAMNASASLSGRATGSSLELYTVSVTLTSVQVEVPFTRDMLENNYGMDCWSDRYTFSLTAPVYGFYYFVGELDWSSTVIVSTSALSIGELSYGEDVEIPADNWDSSIDPQQETSHIAGAFIISLDDGTPLSPMIYYNWG